MADITGKKRSKIITVTSLKGGVGKSTVTANLAFALASRGKRTLAVDCDLSIRNLDLIMGLEDSVVYDLGDALRGDVPPQKTVVPDPRSTELFLCAAPFSDPGDLTEEAFGKVVSALSESGLYDFIIIDTPGDAGPALKLATPFSDLSVITTTHNPASLRAAERTASVLRAFGAKEYALVINGFSYGETHLGYRPGILSIIDRSGVPLLGIIPYSESIERYQEEGILVGQTSLHECRAAFDNIAARICGEDVRLFNGFPGGIRKRCMEAI